MGNVPVRTGPRLDEVTEPDPGLEEQDRDASWESEEGGDVLRSHGPWIRGGYDPYPAVDDSVQRFNDSVQRFNDSVQRFNDPF